MESKIIEHFNITESKNSKKHLIKSLVENIFLHFPSTSSSYKKLSIHTWYFKPFGRLIAKDIEANFIYIIKSKEIAFNWLKKLVNR